MFEIELKAHVLERNKTIENLNSFAKFSGHVERHDTYYHIPSKLNSKGYISARIRKEVSNSEERFILTYKRKELKIDSNGNETEVNDEKETFLENPEPLVTLFSDSGFTISNRKDKIVDDWTVKTDFGIATLELCTVAPLGDFLEIEILSNTNDEKTVELIQSELFTLLKKSGIPFSQIEKRYYNDMLKEVKKGE